VKLEDLFEVGGRKTCGEEERDGMVDASWAWRRSSQGSIIMAATLC
jgi:hypothetical protein